MTDRHASDCAVHNGQGPCDCWVDLIDRARKLATMKRYSFVGRTDIAVDAEELIAMKTIIHELADALEARLPKGDG